MEGLYLCLDETRQCFDVPWKVFCKRAYFCSKHVLMISHVQVLKVVARLITQRQGVRLAPCRGKPSDLVFTLQICLCHSAVPRTRSIWRQYLRKSEKPYNLVVSVEKCSYGTAAWELWKFDKHCCVLRIGDSLGVSSNRRAIYVRAVSRAQKTAKI